MGHRLWFRRNAGQERLTFLSNLPETTLKSNEKCHFSGASVYHYDNGPDDRHIRHVSDSTCLISSTGLAVPPEFAHFEGEGGGVVLWYGPGTCLRD
jgi:hypothetical protein